MKSLMKKMSKLFLIMITCFSMVAVNAETAPSSLKMTHYTKSSTPMSFPANFHVKKTTGGKYTYCTYYGKNSPVQSITYKKGSLVKDNGMNYILKSAYGASDDSNYFIYQTALWTYMVDKGLMKGAYYDLTVFKSRLSSSSSTTANKIKTLVSNAKKAGANDTSAPTISVDTTGVNFALDSSGKYYVSSPIKVTSSTGKFTITLSAPSGSTSTVNGNTFYIKVPKSSITSLNTTVSFNVSNSRAVYQSYYYNPSNSAYQVMAATYKTTKTASAKGSLSIQSTSSIDVIKTDAEGNALSGAGMQVVNSNGTVVDSWTSTGEKHTVKGLTQGTYTVKEISAPAGYKLATNTITFKVDANGKTTASNGTSLTLVQFKNDKTSITISKQDITNKSELPGATLVIKNKDGKEIAKWTSSTKRYVIKGLGAGTYTLTETIAPNGYILSTETITFKVDGEGKLYDKDGKAINKVIMYNQKKVTGGGASVSKQDITNGKELPGATLVVKDSNNNIVDTWISTDTPHLIENLKAGIYTLTETIAPNGYVLSTETISFTVKDDGTVTKVVMYNSPNSKEVPVENTASFKTITSTIAGMVIIVVGAVMMVRNFKRKED